MNDFTINARLSNVEVLEEVKRLTANERAATARLIAALGELDARRLYLGEGCSSLFTYCTQILHFSEHAAYLRIEAARAARKWPAILDLLAEGAVHLTAISLLAAHLTEENHRRVLAIARHKSKREVEEIVASLRPQPAVLASLRKLPAPRVQETVTTKKPLLSDVDAVATRGVNDTSMPAHRRETQARAAEVKALAPERYKVQFTASRETHDKLREAQNLLRHCILDGDIAAVFDRALTALLAELRKARHAAVDRPRTAFGRSTGRHVPAAVKRAVWERDQGRCAFVGPVGRCTERGFLEYHHRVPYADGGATTSDNLELRCRAHNAYESERWFGTGEDDLVREPPARFDGFVQSSDTRAAIQTLPSTVLTWSVRTEKLRNIPGGRPDESEQESVTFTIRNHGPAVHLRLIAVDGRGKVMAVDPAALDLAAPPRLPRQCD